MASRSILLRLAFLTTVGWLGTANATGTMQWTYAGQVYPNQAAAVAAMQAAQPSNSALTQQGPISGMGTANVTYTYVAPALTPTVWYGAVDINHNGNTYLNATYGNGNPAEPTAAAAYQFLTSELSSLPGNPGACNLTSLTSNGPFTSPYYWNGLWYSVLMAYTPTFTGSNATQCAEWWEGQAYITENSGCLPYYNAFNGDTSPVGAVSCTDTQTATITANLLDCPANGSASTQVGDPCDVSTGDFSQTEADYSASGLPFTRYYHSATLESTHNLGVGWTHNYAAYLVLNGAVPVGLLRPDGHHDAVQFINGEYVSLSGAGVHIQQSGSNWVAYMADGSAEVYNGTGQLIQKVTPGGLVTTLTYNTSGLLTSVGDPFGHSLQLAYNSNNQISTVTEPDGVSAITYAYGAGNNLVSVTYPDGSVRQYQYQNTSFPNNLTAVVDESGTLFLTVAYDPNTGAATSSQQAGGAQAVAIAYSTNSATVTDSLGATHTYAFTSGTGYSPRVTSVTYNSLVQSFAVPSPSTDPQQRVTQRTDANGNVTTYSYDTDHLTSKTEALGSPQTRTTSYQYLAATTALPTLVTEALRQTSYAYYGGTNLVQTKAVTDPATGLSRTWSYTYDSYGRVLTAKGPRTDVNSTTTYTYYTCATGGQCGQVQTVTDAFGHVTTYSAYNAFGQPLTITDPNGTVTTLTYDGRQRLLSRQVGSELTSFSYYSTGLLQRVTQPDGSYLQYAYDGAHRLTQMTDSLGNRIVYTLDGMGNRIAENSYDPSGTLHHTHTRVFNALNELYQDVNAAGAAVTTTYAYDNNGNQTTVNAPLGRNTANSYDALNRLSQVTDPAGGVTRLTYDTDDDLTSVVDPRGLDTAYTFDGFGDALMVVSPDTGTTTNTYDSAGNLATSTDARGAVSTYTYDALNRMTSASFTLNGTTDQSITYTYDTGTNGIGHMTGASDANHTMAWSYDPLGRVIGKAQVVNGVTKSVGYGYANADLTSLVTPSGQTVTYAYTNHQVTSISVNGTALLSGVTYEPFGAANGWTWGNGTVTSRTYDTDEKIVAISSAGQKTYTYDDAFRITGINDTSTGSADWTYGYDLLDRLTSATSGSTTDGWTYDASGNRTAQTGSAPSTYTISGTSNLITKITGAAGRTYSYDAAGNMLGYNGRVSITYNNRGRMVTASAPGGSSPYVYNALGQLIETNLSTVGVRLFMYDEAGHYLGVYNGTGGLGDETIWLGDVPVVAIVPNGASVNVYYVHSDQLNTPRQITRATDNTQMWTWFSDPFGTTAENQNPAGNGTLNYPPRFPGVVSTTELAGLYQNGFRDYDPVVGRYIESDLLGLGAGVNTYAYVRANPISRRDLYGLLPGDCYLTQNVAGENAVNDINWESIQTNTEYAGRIYQNSDGTYSYTAPVPGTATTSDPGPLTPNSVGTYHTHGATMPGYNGEAFSPADISFSIGEGLFIPGYIAYLGTPNGVIEAFDPHSYIGDPLMPRIWNLPYPLPGQAVPCSCAR
jgi:RHS repeat-associated protein